MKKKILIVGSLFAVLIAAQSFAQKDHHDMTPTNLKVLPKDISGEELHKVMREYSMALGVHCDFCHVKKEGMENGHPIMDFASDEKPEKTTARDMMRMTADINQKYLAKMGDHKLEQISCVTCHGGRVMPNVSVDSLKRKS